MLKKAGAQYDELLGVPRRGELVHALIFAAFMFAGVGVVRSFRGEGLGGVCAQAGLVVVLMLGGWWLPRLIRVRVSIDSSKGATIKRYWVFGLGREMVVESGGVRFVRLVRSPRGIRGELVSTRNCEHDLGVMPLHYAPALEMRLRLLAQTLEVDVIERAED